MKYLITILKHYGIIIIKTQYIIYHHQSHVTYAFTNSGFQQSDILAIDGIGSKFRCVFFDKDYKLHDLSEQVRPYWLVMESYV